VRSLTGIELLRPSLILYFSPKLKTWVSGEIHICHGGKETGSPRLATSLNSDGDSSSGQHLQPI